MRHIGNFVRMKSTISASVDDLLIVKLEEMRVRLGLNRSQVVERAIEQYLRAAEEITP